MSAARPLFPRMDIRRRAWNGRFAPRRGITDPFCLCRKPFSLNAGRPAGCAEVPLPSRTDAIGGHPITFQWNDTGGMRGLFGRRFPTTVSLGEDIHAGVQSLAIIQRICCGCRHREHCFARLDLFHSHATVEGHNGYGFQRLCLRILRRTISGNIRALSH